jgi:hypothetical protein
MVETDMQITGRLASFSRGGMIQDVSNRLLGEFATCLSASLQTEAAPEPDVAAAGAASPEQPAPAAPAEHGHGHRPHVPHPHVPHIEPAKPINAFKLMLGVLRDRLGRLWGRIAGLFGRAPRSGR